MTPEIITNPAVKKSGLRNPFIVRRLDAHIQHALDTGQPLPMNAARVLAACFHPGIESALCTFAATGRLDAHQAAIELGKTPLKTHAEPGFQALNDYVTARIEATTTTPKGDAIYGTHTNTR